MANKGPQKTLGATDSGSKPGGCFPLGSARSRAAARSLVTARKASEEDELRFEVRSAVDGSPVNLNGIADVMRAARMKDQGEELPASRPAIEGEQEHSEDSWEDCVTERIRMARDRVAKAQDPAIMH